MLVTIDCSSNAKSENAGGNSRQARIDRLLDEAASLRRANDIRAYVDAVRTTVASDTTSMAPDAIERWSKWALSEADRIDPVKKARFLEDIEAGDNVD
jgi:hypothetical protein